MFENQWKKILTPLLETDEIRKLLQWVKNERETKEIYPKEENVFLALKMTDYSKVKVVLLGQDPYHGEGQAMGLSFSVPQGVALPPSLRNIYKELGAEYGHSFGQNGDLTSWAKQGVLLLNTSLTVEKKKAGSHAKRGWEKVTDAVIDALNEREEPVVFLLLGNHALQKAKRIDREKHTIVSSAHPSPLSAYRGFFGSNVFLQVNDALVKNGHSPIDWGSVNQEEGAR